MRVRILAGLAIVALVVLSAVKAVGVVKPDWLEPRPLELGSAAALVAAGTLMVAFFTQLRSQLEERGLWPLATAATLGISGAGIGMLVDLRGLLASVGLARTTREAVAACSLGEFVAAAALLSFFVILHRRAAPLLRGTALAIAGSSIFVALALTVFLLRLTGPGPEWLLGWSHLPALLLAPAAVLALSGLVRFFALLAANPSPPLA